MATLKIKPISMSKESSKKSVTVKIPVKQEIVEDPLV